MIRTLGNFATKLLRDDKTGITRLHGQAELLDVGRRVVRLFPIFHPAAALYTPRMLQTLREDFLQLPDLLAMPSPEQPEWSDPPEPAPEQTSAGSGAGPEGVAEEAVSAAEAEPDQLGLF